MSKKDAKRGTHNRPVVEFTLSKITCVFISNVISKLSVRVRNNSEFDLRFVLMLEFRPIEEATFGENRRGGPRLTFGSYDRSVKSPYEGNNKCKGRAYTNANVVYMINTHTCDS